MLLMVARGVASQWSSVAVDVGQRFVFGLFVRLLYCFSHTGVISSCYVRRACFLEPRLAA